MAAKKLFIVARYTKDGLRKNVEVSVPFRVGTHPLPQIEPFNVRVDVVPGVWHGFTEIKITEEGKLWFPGCGPSYLRDGKAMFEIRAHGVEYHFDFRVE
ncbi:MAG: hypothetical protein K6E59_05900 [Bacilli bacterium]|nr:hypothetical protein [Bacilli bacterium]